ncbi:DUF5677 domain-containing protein [Pseudoxanthomonas sp. KAs_5_3]|uniref:DUF5677 domain-containing protein n=2 Tax=unclassified Pseudoxanthomonas TaxID=2645906 RepID=UPI0008E5DFDA|nr:DUF5677 domain-containing protein [Pseudoxanthomonas sp. KAs_5_3]SFV30751.1 hypothetical protein SAMN05428990_1780 [Pseudoxanthomonas sp. YR558]
MMNESRAEFEDFLERYVDNVSQGMRDRWALYRPDTYNHEGSDAIAGLVARQATLAIEFAQNPGMWNGNLAPLVLRAMTDTHITLAWILKSPIDRGREYIKYGLGQEKLQIELLENEEENIPDEEKHPALSELIEHRRRWLNSQLQEWAIDVNLGSWSGKSTRDMAMEAECESLYKFAYMPFSGAAHSMWQHVGIYNVERCKRALHKGHRIPQILSFSPDIDYLYRSSKYVSRTYSALSSELGLQVETILPVEFFLQERDRLNDAGNVG